MVDAPDDMVEKVCNRLEHSDEYIVFDHVTFSYEGREPDLEDITFSLKKGETLGILGVTGAGKSTLAQLLLRFYDPAKGAIYIEGEDIRAIPYEELTMSEEQT